MSSLRWRWAFACLVLVCASFAVLPSSARAGLAAPRTTQAGALATSPVRERAAAPPLIARPAEPIASEYVRFAGTLPSRFVRPVSLQLITAGRWVTVAKGRTTSRGAFTLRGRAAASVGGRRVFRVIAPSVRINGSVRSQITTASKAVRSGAQTASLTMPASTLVNKPTATVLTFAPARAGRRVQLQQFTAGAWTTVTSGTQTSSGTASLTVVGVSSGAYSYRAVTVAANGAAAKTSPIKVVQIDPDPVQTAENVEVLNEAETQGIQIYDPSAGELVFGPDAPDSAKSLPAGTVIPIPPRPDAVSGALVKVVSSSTADGSTTYETESVDLPEIIENVPDDAAEVAFSPIGENEVTDVADGVTIDPAPATGFASRSARTTGVIAVDGPPVSATISKTFTKDFGGGLSTSAVLSGTVKITPGVELALDQDWTKIKYYKVGAYLKANATLTAKASGNYTAGWEQSLFTVRVVRGGVIGVVPIWVQLTGVVKLRVAASGEVSATVTWSKSDTAYAGVEGRSTDGLTPRPYQAMGSTAASFKTVEAVGTVTGQTYADIDISLYSAAGPFLRLGYEAVGTLIANPSATPPFSCSIYRRPLARVGLRTSDDLKKLIKKQFTPFSHDFTFTKTTINACPSDGGTDPVFDDYPIPYATAGDPYAHRFVIVDNRPGTWAWVPGSVPPSWLNLDPSTGRVVGTPSEADLGSHPVAIQFTDTGGRQATLYGSICVAPEFGPSEC